MFCCVACRTGFLFYSLYFSPHQGRQDTVCPVCCHWTIWKPGLSSLGSHKGWRGSQGNQVAPSLLQLLAETSHPVNSATSDTKSSRKTSRNILRYDVNHSYYRHTPLEIWIVSDLLLQFSILSCNSCSPQR